MDMCVGVHYCTFITVCSGLREGRRVRLVASATWRWLSSLGEERHHVGYDLTVVAGDIAKGRDGSLGIGLYQVANVSFQRVEDGDENMDVIDANAHLYYVMLFDMHVLGDTISIRARGGSGGGRGGGKEGRKEGRERREGGRGEREEGKVGQKGTSRKEGRGGKGRKEGEEGEWGEEGEREEKRREMKKKQVQRVKEDGRKEKWIEDKARRAGGRYTREKGIGK